MKLSYRWLGEMVDLSEATPDKVEHKLTFHTAAIEDQESVGGGLGALVTGRVTAVRPHPNADKLRLCTVDVGTAESEVVCGAPNVAEGQTIVYAPEGATLPGGPDGKPLTLERRAIRGVESCGMICSEREMGLGEDHDGILVLPEGTPVGVPFIEALAIEDTLFEVDNVSVTHRPDLWGHVGWGRELGALLRQPFEAPPVLDTDVLPAEGEPFPIAIDDEQGCRRYVGIVIENLTNGPSPLPLRRRLESLGVRSIDLLVDLTNLVLLEQGQPLHAFDIRDVRGGEIRVRSATDGEVMTTLDGQQRSLTTEDLVIADGEGPVAIAGVMGGENSEVRADTTAILLESATFDPVRIRRTATRLGLRTEASSRFEKSLDPELALQAALRFAYLVKEHVPEARFSRPLSDCYPRPYETRELWMPYALVRRRLGARIADHRVRAILSSLGFGAREQGDGVHVTVPTWRNTKDIERPDDLVEEVGRVAGYHRIASVAPIAPMTPKRPRPVRALERRVASVLSLEQGYAEVKHRSFYSAHEAERIGLGDVDHLRVVNPSSEEHSHMIQTTAPEMLQTILRNQVREPSGHVWEGARLFAPRTEGLPFEKAVFALATWAADEDTPGERFLALVHDVRSLLSRLGVHDIMVANAEAPALDADLPAATWLHPGRTARVMHGDVTLAIVGEVLPAIARRYEIAGKAALAEIDAEALLAAHGEGGMHYEPVLRYPVVPFDVAVIVPRTTPAGDVQRVMQEAVTGSIRGLHVFDVYEGENIPDGARSLALRCELFDRERTLSTKAADALRKRVTDALAEAGWTVRAS
ncbi:MAG: phenylalanine--tRNA ligase subunit beta [Planctomycetota bacterium]|nr:phenylalanine--tRNA ligase subunit beta [Planctomycetota bacterium]